MEVEGFPVPFLFHPSTCFVSLYFALTLFTGLGSALSSKIHQFSCEKDLFGLRESGGGSVSFCKPAHEDIFIPLLSYQKV